MQGAALPDGGAAQSFGALAQMERHGGLLGVKVKNPGSYWQSKFQEVLGLMISHKFVTAKNCSGIFCGVFGGGCVRGSSAKSVTCPLAIPWCLPNADLLVRPSVNRGAHAQIKSENRWHEHT